MGTILLAAHKYESRKPLRETQLLTRARCEYSVMLPPTCLHTSSDPRARTTIDKGGNYCLPSGYCFLNKSSHGQPKASCKRISVETSGFIFADSMR